MPVTPGAPMVVLMPSSSICSIKKPRDWYTVRLPWRVTFTPVVVRRASSMVVSPWSSSWVLVMTLTDCGVSRGERVRPVVVRIAEVV